jgi:hypothetical protein
MLALMTTLVTLRQLPAQVPASVLDSHLHKRCLS